MPTATAADLARALAAQDNVTLTSCQAELAAAVTELHRRGPDGGPEWTVDDPLVALVRAVAILARRHPDTASPAAARVIEHLAAGRPAR